MAPHKHLFTAILLTLVLTAPSRSAEQPTGPSPAELRLRDALKNTMLQLRAAQDEKAAMEANLAAAQQERDALKVQLKEQADKLGSQITDLTKQQAVAQKATEKAITDLDAQITEKEHQILVLNASLENWKTGYAKVADIAKTKEAERAALATDKVLLQRKVEDYEAKNVALSKLSREVLARYEKFSLGEALTAQEPFVGVTRVKIENLIQDFADKLDQQRIASTSKPSSNPTTVPTETATNSGPSSPAQTKVSSTSDLKTVEQIIAAENRLVSQNLKSGYLLPDRAGNRSSTPVSPLPQTSSGTGSTSTSSTQIYSTTPFQAPTSPEVTLP